MTLAKIPDGFDLDAIREVRLRELAKDRPPKVEKETVAEWLERNKDAAITVYDNSSNLVGIKVDANDIRNPTEIAKEFKL